MKKVLFICDVRDATFGIAARGVVYQEYLMKNGWECEFVSCTKYDDMQHLPDNIKVPYRQMSDIIALAQKSLIVYFIKIVDEQLVWKIHNDTKAILLYDFYDVFWKAQKYRYNAILDLIDVFITEGTYLCDFLAHYNKPVFEIKSACVYDAYSANKQRGKSLVIGWLGSSSTFKAIYKVREALENIGSRYPDTELRIVGANEHAGCFENIKVTYRPVYNHQEMIEELSKFDIGIFPPPSDEFDYLVRGPHKGVRYMGVGIPAVFYDYGDCKLFVRDMENAVLYKNEEEFEEKVSQLIENEELRKKLGKAGYETVYSMYSVESCAQSLLGVFEAVPYLYVPRFHL